MVLSWIQNTISKDLLDSVEYTDSVSEVWSDLQERFSQGNTSRVNELKLEFAIITQRTRIVAAYLTKLKPIWDELQAYEPVPICTCGCTCGATKEYVKTRETEKVHQFLIGLNENFSTMLSQILNMELLPTLNMVYVMATKEEKQEAVAPSRGPIVEATTLVVRTGSNGRQNSIRRTRCDHCKKLGHSKERCFEIIEYPPNWKSGGIRPKGKVDGQKSSKELIFATNVNLDSSNIEGSSYQSPIARLNKEQYD
ncbi:hypothetical protein SLEP1_g22030 [Rubroshorea leprosula]|uniref:Retrotransposon gag domain-containing protein n=1 Tax=Rubroshorea leprosula TaxID=152421 RepID=A0AAV5J7W4_9ROSI|nr:hypothetical protein SLEP1_g22030 [Rubroshorea leprosula]